MDYANPKGWPGQWSLLLSEKVFFEIAINLFSCTHPALSTFLLKQPVKLLQMLRYGTIHQHL
jgi:hypothetical protein